MSISFLIVLGFEAHERNGKEKGRFYTYLGKMMLQNRKGRQWQGNSPVVDGWWLGRRFKVVETGATRDMHECVCA